MRKKLAAITIGGASLLGGGVIGVVVGGPGLALAQDAAATAGDEATTSEEVSSRRDGRLAEVLDGLVADGTLTREQADAVASRVAEARPERADGPGRGGLLGAGRGFSLTTVAETLGLGEEEVREALADGTTVAELAEAQGVEIATVVDALVAAATTHLAEAVEAGRLEQARADELLAALPERIATLVEEGRPTPVREGMGRGGGHHRGPRAAAPADADADDSAEATA